MQLVIAEKPSVGRDLARVLGVRGSGRHSIEGQGRVITWCVGHLVELDEPASYEAAWKSWRLDTLPMLPEEFRLRPSQGTKDQFDAVRSLLRDRRFTEVVNACDAGREGELIFRYVYQLSGSRLPVRRLWISSLTEEAIRLGFEALKPGARYDALADAARCRSEADWLVGMNATRAVTVRARGKGFGERGPLYSIGRVQTPTLAMLVRREREILAFVPRDYWEVRGRFSDGTGMTFAATWRYAGTSRLADAEAARTIAQRDARVGGATEANGPRVEKVQQKTVREPPPLLFDLTSLQRTANKRYGMSAARTLEVAQALYETHKLLSYPRTDSRHLTADLVPTLPQLFRTLAAVPDYEPFASPLVAKPPRPTRRVVDDAKVHDHHAIIPTGKAVSLDRLSPEERRIFDLVARRFLGVFWPDAEFAQTEVVVLVPVAAPVTSPVTSPSTPQPSAATTREAAKDAMHDEAPPPPDRYYVRGKARLVAGWQDVAGIRFGAGSDASAEGEPGNRRPARSPKPDRGPDARVDREPGVDAEAGAEDEPLQALPKLVEGQRLDGEFDALAKQTRPPPRYSEASLLGAMEAAGKSIDDEALREAMKECGLGTPATRASTIETLLKRGYLARQGKQLTPTEMGMALVEAIPVESLTSAELTGAWEARLSRIARGEERRAVFMADIERYVREVVQSLRASAPPVAGAFPSTTAPAWDRPELAREPRREVPSDARRQVPGDARREVPRDARREVPRAARREVPGDARREVPGDARRQGPRDARHEVPRDARWESGQGALREGGRRARASVPEAAPARAAKRPKKPARTSTPPVAAGAKKTSAAVEELALECPRCHSGQLVTGKRAWGCSRWREGCALVVSFEVNGKRLSQAQLRDLVTRGKTRSAKWGAGSDGSAVSGRLILDVRAPAGQSAARLVAD